MQSLTVVASDKSAAASAAPDRPLVAQPSAQPFAHGRRPVSSPPSFSPGGSLSPAPLDPDHLRPSRGRPPTPVDLRGSKHAFAVATPTLLDAALSRLVGLSLHGGDVPMHDAGDAPDDARGPAGDAHGAAAPVALHPSAGPTVLRPPQPPGLPPQLRRRPCASLPTLPSSRAAASFNPPRPRAITLPRDTRASVATAEVGRDGPRPGWLVGGSPGLHLGPPPAWPAPTGPGLSFATYACGRARSPEEVCAPAPADDGPPARKRQRSRH